MARTALRAAALLAFLLGLGASGFWLAETRGFELIRRTPLRSCGLVLVLAALTSANLLLRWLRWGFLLRRFHVRPPTRDTFRAFFATLPASFTPLYVGEMVRGLLITKRGRQLMPIVAWVWFVERCSDAAALLVLWGAATARPELFIAGSLCVLLAPWLLARSTLAGGRERRLHTAQLRPSSTMIVCASLSLAAWIIPVVGTQIALSGFGVAWAPSLACAAFTRGTLLGGLSGVPGGAGIAGSGMILHLIAGGVDEGRATAAVAVLRLGTHGYALLLGCLLAVVWRRDLIGLVRARSSEQQHFDELSATYAQDIPEHVRKRLLERKVDAMLRKLTAGEAHGVRGLDLGCGHGWYAAELTRRGYRMTGIDLSKGQVAQAREYCRDQGLELELAAYDGKRIPYADASFDFAYSINVLHHVISPRDQELLLAEIVRVLKPNGLFFLHEMNVENPLFRVYMSYVFPLLKSIDEGTELWLLPSQLPAVGGAAWQPEVAYFTFLPEFLPGPAQRLFEPVERWLERSSLRRYAAHYMAAMRRN